MKQTDFPDYKRLYDEGCLLMSLLDIVQESFEHAFSKIEIVDLYGHLNTLGALGTSVTPKDTGAYVYNHAQVLSVASWKISDRAMWEYVGRIYTQSEEERGRTSFGSYKDSTHQIFQIQTADGIGHFRRLDYDPWGPGTQMVYLKSVRYYRRMM